MSKLLEFLQVRIKGPPSTFPVGSYQDLNICSCDAHQIQRPLRFAAIAPAGPTLPFFSVCLIWDFANTVTGPR